MEVKFNPTSFTVPINIMKAQEPAYMIQTSVNPKFKKVICSTRNKTTGKYHRWESGLLPIEQVINTPEEMLSVLINTVTGFKNFSDDSDEEVKNLTVTTDLLIPCEFIK